MDFAAAAAARHGCRMGGRASFSERAFPEPAKLGHRASGSIAHWIDAGTTTAARAAVVRPFAGGILDASSHVDAP